MLNIFLTLNYAEALHNQAIWTSET